MKFAFIADVHLSGYSQDKIVNQLPERLNSLKNILYQIANYCIENKINTVVIGGDLLHGKSLIHAVAQSIMLEYFRDFTETLEFIIIDGNHDVSAKGKDAVSALKSLDNEPNVIRYKEPTMVGDVYFVPWSFGIAEIIKNNKAKYLISHFGLNEGILNSGASIISDLGIPDLAGKYKYVILGHYHKPQSIIRKDIELYYVGSPIQIDWGEKNEEKRFLVIDTDNDIINSIPTQGYTKYCEFIITPDNSNEIVQEAIKLKGEGHFVKLVKTESIDTLALEKDFIVVDRTEKDITNRGVNTSMSMDDKLQSFLDIKQIPKELRSAYIIGAKEIIDDTIL